MQRLADIVQGLDTNSTEAETGEAETATAPEQVDAEAPSTVVDAGPSAQPDPEQANTEPQVTDDEGAEPNA